jgi:hypothetical protein
MLSLTISFELGQVGAFAVAFDCFVHGFVANKGTIQRPVPQHKPLNYQCYLSLQKAGDLRADALGANL